MPIGGFLDSLPSILFVIVHLVLLAVAVWAIWRLNMGGIAYAWAFSLYAISQLVFLSFFGGIITIKMAVLLEQLLIVAMVVWIVMVATQAGARSSR